VEVAIMNLLVKISGKTVSRYVPASFRKMFENVRFINDDEFNKAVSFASEAEKLFNDVILFGDVHKIKQAESLKDKVIKILEYNDFEALYEVPFEPSYECSSTYEMIGV
jgi:hypothetical protein